METRHMQPVAPTRTISRPAVRANSEPAPKRIDLTLNMPQARSAAVAGSFNNWDLHQTPMRKDSGNGWKATLSLPPGRYEYRFVVDGKWISDPNAKESVTNPFGDTNSILVVTG